MTIRSITAFVAALCACGATSIHADPSEPFRVRIHLSVDRSIASRPIAGPLKDEAEAIWRSYGVQLEWIETGGAEPLANGVSLEAIVERRFEGAEPMGWSTVLGRAVVKFDAPNWRPIRVSFDAAASILSLRTTGRASMPYLVLDRDAGRALGRVLAHEIGHVILGAPYHDRSGLMRAAFSADELAEPDRTPFALTSSSVDRLRNRLRTLAIQAAP